MTAKGKKPPAKKVTRTKDGSTWRTSTWIGFTIIISIWMFIFGILVGRGTVSSQFNFENAKKELYAQAEKADRTAQQSEMTISPTKKTGAKPSQNKKNLSQHPSSKDPHVIQKSPKKSVNIKQPPKQPKKNHQKKMATPTKTRKTTSVRHLQTATHKQKTMVNASQTIQVAAMKNLADAKRMMTRLQKQGYPAYLASAILPGKGMTHRVRVGPYKSGVQAKNTLNQLKKMGIEGILLKGR